MKILGIIAEYNPFHNGHKYHLQKSKEISGADCTVAVMSGHFTQRGEPAVLDKWTRSHIAVEAGVDLVLELPFIFACNRSEMFARGAVDILAGIGADCISFGSENGDIERLTALARDLKEHEWEIEELRTEFMKEGNSFAKCSQLAAEHVFGKEKAAPMLLPNNILALEYLKRLLFRQEKGQVIEPLTIKRFGSGYAEAVADRGFAGARAIREMLDEAKSSDLLLYEKLIKFMPKESAQALSKDHDFAEAEARAFLILRSEIVKNSPEELCRTYCIGEGLENRMKKEIVRTNSLQELISTLVSRRYTGAAVRRMLVYLLMGIREREPQMDVYGRVLAANETGRKMLKELRKRDKDSHSGDDGSSIPIITNVNKDGDMAARKKVESTLQYDMLATDMYNILFDRDMYKFSDKVMKPYICE